MRCGAMSDPLRDCAPEGMSVPDGLLAEVRAAYATPGRAYHDHTHVVEVAQHFADVGQRPGWQRPREVYLAVLFHDAVYVPGRGDNEARSAELAQQALERWLPDAGLDAGYVRELIELTARHGSLGPSDVDVDAAQFLDCDMAILAAPPAAFDAYDAAIATEYRALPPERYAAGRRAFLAHLLARPRIFLSEHFHERLDAAARTNLRRALARLPAEPSG